MTFSFGGVSLSVLRLEARVPPPLPMTSMLPPIFRPGGGPALRMPRAALYFELSFTIETGIAPRRVGPDTDAAAAIVLPSGPNPTPDS